ncbi:unnamed protein product [Vitrella brassicaformis CCMP3155]|uniref:Uncharacterized protein n=1 Tax=Vitrella brassicaformis (strain CCMP3155) TaxID=1169540 RepID=A0A0G4E8N3_VITBC|nr:unnamed protein product [Vitrella brassicaformis CCMP3155]|eukprot:CEL91722.1 unnamed protein product [Vitrella brassicaformis CCMP3155]
MMDTDNPQQQHQQQQQQQQATPSHSIDLEAFAQRFGQVPAVVAYVFSFLSLHLVAALPQRLWRHVGSQITRLVMDTHDTAERRFWWGLSFNDAFEWGRRLTGLESIVVRCPSGFRSNLGYTHYGYLERIATGQQAGSTLESIEYSKSGSRIHVDEEEDQMIMAAEQRPASFPPPLNPPPTLTALTSMTIRRYRLSYPGGGRHWRLPSLERLHIVGMVGRETLGGLVATARRLKELHVDCHPDAMAESLAQIPTAAAGQPGLLSQLEDIGTLTMPKIRAAGLQRLQAVLVDRGCRSIKKLSIKIEESCIDIGSCIDSRIFKTLSAIEALTRTVCVRPDIPVDILVVSEFEDDDGFDLGLLCKVPTRPAPSPFVQNRLQQLAAASHSVCFIVRAHYLTIPGPLDTPSPAGRSLAQCLTFSRAESVVVKDMEGCEPNPDADQPDPVVFDSMPPNAFPAASLLFVDSSKGLEIGRRLVTKMPVLKRIKLWGPTEQAVAVLQALGGERELESFHAGYEKGVGEGVPEDLRDGDAAGEFGIACVKSLLKIRGIKKLTFEPVPSDAFQRLVEERTHGDTIEGIEGRFDISWTGEYDDDELTLQRLDA